MEFILQSQARAEARMDRAEARMDRMEAQFNRRIQAITKLIQTGMRMLVRLEKTQRELAVAQKETDRKLRLFLDSLRKGANGRRR